MKTQLPVNVLKAVSFHTAKNSIRRYLNGVYVEQGRMTATDGHTCLTVPNTSRYGRNQRSNQP